MTSVPRPGLVQLNTLLDALPRTRFGALAREAPAFRSCGVAGYHLAVAATLAAALLGSRSLLVATVLAAVSAFSFFALALARKRIRGREELVLLEHVWFTLACTAAAARWLGGGAGALDPVAVGLAFFLASGRLGCTLVGCCHGRPSSVGLVYDERHASDGFPRHLVGVRLFPVQLLESAGLLVIGATGLAVMPFATSGAVLAWFLLAYATLRFALEGLRGDVRPHLLGLSQSRWMAIAEAAFAVAWGDRDRIAAGDPRTIAAGAFLGFTLAVALVLRRAFDRRARLLARSHCDELRSLLASLGSAATTAPAMAVSSLGVSLALSTAGRSGAHVSLVLPEGLRDVPLACELATLVVPSIDTELAEIGEAALHLWTPLPCVGVEPDGGASTADALYAAVVRKAQHGSSASTGKDPPSQDTADVASSRGPLPLDVSPFERRGYFLPRSRSRGATSRAG